MSLDDDWAEAVEAAMRSCTRNPDYRPFPFVSRDLALPARRRPTLGGRLAVLRYRVRCAILVLRGDVDIREDEDRY